MGIGRRIGVRILFGRGIAKPRNTPDRRFIKLVPKRTGPHEGLVVKTCREEHPQPVIDRTQIGFERRPAVLAHGGKTIMHFDIGGPQIGGESTGAPINRNERIGLFTACG